MKDKTEVRNLEEVNAIFEKIVGLIIAYLMGCICAGYYLTRFISGKDVRQTGSKGVGATNVGRFLGKKGFVITFLFDFLKGVLVSYLAQYMGFDQFWSFLLCMMVIIGHIWPVQLNFSGGKGISTYLGAMLVFEYKIIVTVIILFIPSYFIIKKFSIAGLPAIFSLPVVLLVLGYNYEIILLSISLVTILFIAHKSNIMDYFANYKGIKLRKG